MNEVVSLDYSARLRGPARKRRQGGVVPARVHSGTQETPTRSVVGCFLRARFIVGLLRRPLVPRGLIRPVETPDDLPATKDVVGRRRILRCMRSSSATQIADWLYWQRISELLDAALASSAR